MFSKEDLAKFKAFKGVMNQAKFDIQGSAVLAAASLFAWFYDLERKIESGISHGAIISKELTSPIESIDNKPEKKKRGRKTRVASDGV
jgi:hypothetical protein